MEPNDDRKLIWIQELRDMQRIPQQARFNMYDLYVCLYVRMHERVFGREGGAPADGWV